MASKVKLEASKHASIKKGCVTAGQWIHQITKRANLIVQGYKVLKITPLPEEEALNKGVDIMSETSVFLVTVSIVVYEYSKAERNKAVAAEAALQKEEVMLKYLNSRFGELDERYVSLQADLVALNKRLDSFSKETRNLED